MFGLEGSPLKRCFIIIQLTLILTESVCIWPCVSMNVHVCHKYHFNQNTNEIFTPGGNVSVLIGERESVWTQIHKCPIDSHVHKITVFNVVNPVCYGTIQIMPNYLVYNNNSYILISRELRPALERLYFKCVTSLFTET